MEVFSGVLARDEIEGALAHLAEIHNKRYTGSATCKR